MSQMNLAGEAHRRAGARALSSLCAAQIQRPAVHVKHDSVFTMGLGESMDVTVTAAITSVHLGTWRMQSTLFMQSTLQKQCTCPPDVTLISAPTDDGSAIRGAHLSRCTGGVLQMTPGYAMRSA